MIEVEAEDTIEDNCNYIYLYKKYLVVTGYFLFENKEEPYVDSSGFSVGGQFNVFEVCIASVCF